MLYPKNETGEQGIESLPLERRGGGMRQRKSYRAEMKAKIALEAVKGQWTVQELGSHYGVQPS